MRIYRKQKGFTLIELLVVISIIALLSSIVLYSVTQARKKGRDAKRKAEVKQMDTAIQAYINDIGHAPYAASVNCSASAVDWACGGSIYDYSAKWTQLQTELKPYITRLPKDPCGKSCVGDNGEYRVYFYDSPNSISTWCHAVAPNCLASVGQLDQMYIVGTEHLESDGGKWGANRSWSGSY